MKDFKLEFEEKLKYGFIDILILLLLRDEDMYGYQIVQEIEIRSKNKISVKEGSLYGPLYRMQERKFISVKKELVGKRRFRNYYHLEELGVKYLNDSIDSFKEFIFGLEALINWKDDKDE